MHEDDDRVLEAKREGCNDKLDDNGLAFRTFSEAISLAGRRVVLSSGSSGIDSLLEGGYRTGEITEIFGASNSGKTQLAMQATLSASVRGWSSVFIDTEGTFRPERLASIAEARGVDTATALSRVYHVRAKDIDQQFSAIRLIRGDERVMSCRMVVIDTVTKNFTVEYGGSSGMLRRQAILGVYLNELARDAYLHDRAVLLTNRVASVITGYGASREVDLGGDTLRRYTRRAIHLRRQGERVFGSLVGKAKEEAPTSGMITQRGFE